MTLGGRYTFHRYATLQAPLPSEALRFINTSTYRRAPLFLSERCRCGFAELEEPQDLKANLASPAEITLEKAHG
jgi:hypothetical protein